MIAAFISIGYSDRALAEPELTVAATEEPDLSTKPVGPWYHVRVELVADLGPFDGDRVRKQLIDVVTAKLRSIGYIPDERGARVVTVTVNWSGTDASFTGHVAMSHPRARDIAPFPLAVSYDGNQLVAAVEETGQRIVNQFTQLDEEAKAEREREQREDVQRMAMLDRPPPVKEKPIGPLGISGAVLGLAGLVTASVFTGIAAQPDEPNPADYRYLAVTTYKTPETWALLGTGLAVMVGGITMLAIDLTVLREKRSKKSITSSRPRVTISPALGFEF